MKRTPRQFLDVTCEWCGVVFVAHRSSRRYCSKACGRLGRAEDRQCVRCGATYRPHKPSQEFCSVACKRADWSERHAPHVSAAAGDALRGTGEGRTYRNLNGRHEHRVVAEQTLGRPLRPGEVVHHKDGDIHNNDPANLQVLPSQAEHARLHALERRAGRN